MMGVILSIVVTVAASVVCAEARAWTPPIVRWMLAFAVSRAPATLRDRLQEEWSAYLEEVPGQVGRIFAAVGFFIAASKIRAGEQFKALRHRLRLERTRYRFIVQIAYGQAIVGPLNTRIARVISATKFAVKFGDLYVFVAKTIADGVVTTQFGKNIMFGAIKVVRAVTIESRRPSWKLNTATGELLESSEGEPGAVVLSDPHGDN